MTQQADTIMKQVFSKSDITGWFAAALLIAGPPPRKWKLINVRIGEGTACAMTRAYDKWIEVCWQQIWDQVPNTYKTTVSQVENRPDLYHRDEAGVDSIFERARLAGLLKQEFQTWIESNTDEPA